MLKWHFIVIYTTNKLIAISLKHMVIPTFLISLKIIFCNIWYQSRNVVIGIFCDSICFSSFSSIYLNWHVCNDFHPNVFTGHANILESKYRTPQSISYLRPIEFIHAWITIYNTKSSSISIEYNIIGAFVI